LRSIVNVRIEHDTSIGMGSHKEYSLRVYTARIEKLNVLVLKYSQKKQMAIRLKDESMLLCGYYLDYLCRSKV